MRPTTPVLALIAVVVVNAAVPVRAQQSAPGNAPLSTPQALRAQEAACEERLQSIYRQRSEAVTKTHPGVEAKAAQSDGFETAMQAQRNCLTETDEALI